MCGFIGMIRNKQNILDNEEMDFFQKQNDLITHRGPDDEVDYHDQYVSFGFRRLSIIDIDNGAQPLSYDNDKIWLIFNGEIYNFVELHRDLQKEGYTFETDSDTEDIAALFSQHKEKDFKYLRGMFSILICNKVYE